MFWILIAAFSVVQGTPVRICVPVTLSIHCSQMVEDVPDTFSCVTSPDTLGCLRKVQAGEADMTNVDPNGLYVAGKYYDLQPIAAELVNGVPFRAQGVALVRKNSYIQSPEDLRNASSCHTGLGRTVGWQIPLGRLISSRIMTPECGEDELSIVQRFFDGSCVPGPWSTDPVVDKKLKSKYPHLCSRCKDPSTCASNDAYADYDGTMNCLGDGAADVAFTKMPALKKYLEKNPDFEEKVELLCFEGGRKSVLDPNPCVWGVRPTNAFVARKGDPEEQERLVGILLQTQARYAVPKVSFPEWYHETFLSHDNVDGLRPTEPERRTYDSYLGDFIHSVRKPRPGCENDKENQVSFCVTSDEELAKCQDYSKAAEGKDIWPIVGCVKAATKQACMQLLKEDNAQLLVLDGGDVYKAGKYFDLQPVASELYNGSDATYYAVAVLRSASDVTKLSDLRNLRSCHTGIGRTAGWVMPIGALLSEGLLPEPTIDNCNHAAAVADFFADGSCVPGANDTKYNPNRTRSEDLCKHCIGDEEGNNKCSRNTQERFSGYSGALRCLAEGKGDVAFVKHLTVPDYTDGRSDLPWTRDLLSSDFMLLCDGGGTAPASEYLRCNLGKVPSHQVVTNTNISESRHLNLVKLLADSSKFFGLENKDDECADAVPMVTLFGRGEKPDLLFKDSATGLRITPLDSTYEEVLGRRFIEASRAADSKLC